MKLNPTTNTISIQITESSDDPNLKIVIFVPDNMSKSQQDQSPALNCAYAMYKCAMATGFNVTEPRLN